MPFSWLRIPNAYSPKIRACMDDDPSKRRFVECVEGIISRYHGERRGDLLFEVNGRYAHVHVWTETCEEMNRIILDLEAEAVELFTLKETERRIEENEAHAD